MAERRVLTSSKVLETIDNKINIHKSDPSAHHTKTGLDDDPVSGETTKGITSNWAYEHSHDENAHHSKTIDRGALIYLGL